MRKIPSAGRVERLQRDPAKQELGSEPGQVPQQRELPPLREVPSASSEWTRRKRA
jgi:hypothetical protein